MALVGNLKDLKLANIVQLNCMERNEAVFIVETRKVTGKIYFSEGNIAHATCGATEGDEAVYQILAIKEGPFRVENNVAPPKRSINVPWSNLLMEGLRMIDEAMEAKGEAVGKFTKDIKNVNGVQAVLITSKQGEIMTEENVSSGKRTAAAMAFITRKIEKIGRASKSGVFKFGIVAGKNDKKAIAKWGDDTITLSIDAKASVEILEQSVEKVDSYIHRGGGGQ